MTTARTLLTLALLLVATVAGAVSAAPAPPGATSGAKVGGTAHGDVYTLQGAVTVTRPGPGWVFVSDRSDPMAVTLAETAPKKTRGAVALPGAQIVLRLAPNKAHLDARQVAAVIESRFLRAEAATGRKFSVLRSCTLGGLPAAMFTEEHVVVVALQVEYYVATLADRYLVVAVSGPKERLSTQTCTRQIKGVLDGLRFPGLRGNARAASE